MATDRQTLEFLLGPRDRFAFQAMNGLLARQGTSVKPAVVGKMAYDIADAMMRQRGDSEDALQVLRDRIAEQALNGLMAAQGTAARAEVVARMAYELADAMITARSSTKT